MKTTAIAAEPSQNQTVSLIENTMDKYIRNIRAMNNRTACEYYHRVIFVLTSGGSLPIASPCNGNTTKDI